MAATTGLDSARFPSAMAVDAADREALFLLVFGSRPAIKQHLAALLTSAT